MLYARNNPKDAVLRVADAIGTLRGNRLSAAQRATWQRTLRQAWEELHVAGAPDVLPAAVAMRRRGERPALVVIKGGRDAAVA